MRRKQRYPVETTSAPITIEELEIKDIVEKKEQDSNTVIVQILFTNNIKLKEKVDINSIRYNLFLSNLQKGDKVRVRFKASTAIDIIH